MRSGAWRTAIILFLISFRLDAAAKDVHMEKTGEETVDLARAEIWSKELAIYAGRGRGDLGPYIDNTAAGYMAWPPQAAKPLGVGALRQTAKSMPSQEKLTMELVDFTLHGDAAIIYYRTHRTIRPDGAATDEFFETTHTWVREGDDWKLLGGMARPMPERK
jgi:hypothetical protein